MSRAFVLSFLIACSFSSPAYAEYNGLSAFASRASRFPCSRALRIVNHAKQPALAILYGTTWGGDNDYECAKRFLSPEVHGPKLLEVHFSNEVGRRNKTLGEGDFFPQDSVKAYNRRLQSMGPETLEAVTARVREIRDKFGPLCVGDCLLILSTGLEDNYAAGAYENLLAAIRLEWPYITVRSPCKGTTNLAGADLREVHTLKGKIRTACIANEDGNHGQGLTESRAFLRHYKGCCARFLWRGKHQGNTGSKSPPRHKRKLEIPATDIKQLGRLLAAQ